MPLHISAKAEDLQNLMEGVVAYDERVRTAGVDAVVIAGRLAFEFVYIHPFEDGNGRLHRWLIHHTLAAAGYNPPGVVFPVSAAIYREMATHKSVLESYSRPLLDLIEWEPTPPGNVRVLNDTVKYYRFFDATAGRSRVRIPTDGLASARPRAPVPAILRCARSRSKNERARMLLEHAAWGL